MTRQWNAWFRSDGLDVGAPALARDIPVQLVGVSFSIPELMILAGWAEYEGLLLRIDLDICVDGSVYEEVAALYLPGLLLRRWTLWREPNAIVLERIAGPSTRYACMSDLLHRLATA